MNINTKAQGETNSETCRTCGHADLDARNPSQMGLCKEGGRKEFTRPWWRCDRWIARTCNNCGEETIENCARCRSHKHGHQAGWIWKDMGVVT